MDMKRGSGRSASTLLLASACGIIAANIYYLQPLAALVCRSAGIPESAAGLFASLTQLGYGAGLVLVVPLADLSENRCLLTVVLSLSIVALAAAAVASHAGILLAATFLIGLGSVAVQLVVVYAAHLAPEQDRGRVIGAVTAGLMLGITLSRPAASAVAALSSWRVMLVGAAVLVTGTALCLRHVLPERRPHSAEAYYSLVAGLPHLFRETDIVRWRTIIHCNLFFGFGLFWTGVPLVLRERFAYSENGIAVYALTGLASVLAAPIAGFVADRGHVMSGAAASIACVGIGFAAAIVAMPDQGGVGLLSAAAVLIGAGVTGHAVFAQRDVFSMPSSMRARLNGMFMAGYFTAGALGSAAASFVYAGSGWQLTCVAGLAPAVVAMIWFLKFAPDRAEIG